MAIVASVPAEAAADPGPVAAAEPAAPQTDEQILGIEDVSGKPAEAVAAPPAKVEEVPDPNAVKTPEQESAEKLAEDGRLMPVKWREMAAKDPEFRTLFYQNRANAEKLATIEPKFTEMQTAVAAIEKTDTAFLSGDPGAIGSVLQTFVADKPQALLPMLQAGEKLIEQLLPQEHARILGERFTAGLKANNFENVFQILRQAREAGEDGKEVLGSQIDKILEWAGKNGFPTTETERLESRKAELDAREQTARTADETAYNNSTQTFRTAVNEQIDTAIKAEIKTSLNRLLEKAAFTEGARTRIDAEALAEVYKMLSANKDIIDQVGLAIWPNGSKDRDGKIVRGQFNDTTRKTAIGAPVTYAKSVLADVLKRVVENYTKDFMAADATREKKFAAAAGRTEVSGGSNAPRTPKPLTRKDVDYDRMSDDDILGA